MANLFKRHRSSFNVRTTQFVTKLTRWKFGARASRRKRLFRNSVGEVSQLECGLLILSHGEELRIAAEARPAETGSRPNCKTRW